MKMIFGVLLVIGASWAQTGLFESTSLSVNQLSDADQKKVQSLVAIQKGKLVGVFNVNKSALESTEADISLEKLEKSKRNAKIHLKKRENEEYWEGNENGHQFFGLRKTKYGFRGFLHGKVNYLIFGLTENRVALIQESNTFTCGTRGK